VILEIGRTGFFGRHWGGSESVQRRHTAYDRYVAHSICIDCPMRALHTHTSALCHGNLTNSHTSYSISAPPISSMPITRSQSVAASDKEDDTPPKSGPVNWDLHHGSPRTGITLTSRDNVSFKVDTWYMRNKRCVTNPYAVR
jgi:hypothetical protein